MRSCVRALGPERGVKFMLAGLFALCVIGAAILLTVDHLGSPESSSKHALGASSSNLPSGRCGLDARDQRVPTISPKTEWIFVGKYAVPTSKTSGPATTWGGLHSCFAHTPTGALFASVVTTFDFGRSNGVNREFVETRLTDGEQKQILVDQLKTLTSVSADAGVPFQLAGFRIDSYTPDRALIQLAVRVVAGPKMGVLLSTPVSVEWADGDWLLDLDNAPGGAGVQLASLDGFITWSGIQ